MEAMVAGCSLGDRVGLTDDGDSDGCKVSDVGCCVGAVGDTDRLVGLKLGAAVVVAVGTVEEVGRCDGSCVGEILVGGFVGVYVGKLEAVVALGAKLGGWDGDTLGLYEDFLVNVGMLVGKCVGALEADEAVLGT